MLNKIANIIVNVARKEDLILRHVGKGIFHLPELAFTYIIGREIAINAENIFGTSNIEWFLEKNITEKAGRTDLVFEVNKKNGIAIEFKIGGKHETYIKDIEKLKNIPDNYETIFCALIDAWPDQLHSDPRIIAVKSVPGVKPICKDEFFDFFATLSDFVHQICCIVGIWQVSKKTNNSLQRMG